MDSQTDLTVRTGAELAPAEKQFSTAIAITSEYIAQTSQSLALLRQMVNEVLIEGRDYGSIPDVPGEFLWEPGADQIVASFNCKYGSPRVIRQVFTETLIAVILECPIISMQTEKEVAVCVGAASTSEVKHKYRWAKKWELADWGYTDETSIKALKSKNGKDGKPYKWRIPNPEPGDLLNTIWKIAYKRGRVGAAKLLPGVSSALSEKFNTGKEDDGKQKRQREPSTDWDIFWSKTKQLGLTQEQVHQYLGVKSIKDWRAAGKTLDQAIDVLSQSIGTKQAGAESDQFGDEDITDDLFSDAGAAVTQPQYKTDPATLTNIGLFYKACIRDFPDRFRYIADILKAIGKKENEITDFPAEYRKLAEQRKLL